VPAGRRWMRGLQLRNGRDDAKGKQNLLFSRRVGCGLSPASFLLLGWTRYAGTGKSSNAAIPALAFVSVKPLEKCRLWTFQSSPRERNGHG